MKKFITAALSIVAFTSIVSATIIDLTNGYYETFIDGVTETIFFPTLEDPSLEIKVTETKGGTLNWADEESISGYDGDGIGVSDDEIRETGQEIMIQFNQMVYIDDIEVLDLFYEEDNSLQTQITSDSYFEKGFYKIGATETPFYALNHNAGLIWTQASSPAKYGQLIMDVPGRIMTDRIIFGSYDQPLEGNNDYAIAKLGVTSAVPEPGTMALMGFGLISMIGFKFRRNRKKS